VHQRILLAKKRGADIHIAHGAAPHSDMKNFGKKRSPNSRKRGQARVYERHVRAVVVPFLCCYNRRLA